MRKVAILIAVEHYADNRISTVEYAQADANGLASAIQEHGFDQNEQTILVDVSATKATIESRVRKILVGLTEKDTLYVYYAGHGFAKNAKNFITCVDTSLDDLELTSIAVEWLFAEFKRSTCKRIVLFLDSCESGMLADTSIRGIFTDLTEDELRQFFELAEHSVCFAACKPGQRSYPADKYKHGVWTYHLIESLNANAQAHSNRIVTLHHRRCRITWRRRFHERFAPHGQGPLIRHLGCMARSVASSLLLTWLRS